MQILAPHLISMQLYAGYYFYFTLSFSKHFFSPDCVCISGIQSQVVVFFFLACFNAKSFYVVLIPLKFVAIETRGKSQSELASSCIKSSARLLTAMKNNPNSVLFINQGNNLVSQGLSYFPIKIVNGFGRIVYLPLEKLKKKKKSTLDEKGQNLLGFINI